MCEEYSALDPLKLSPKEWNFLGEIHEVMLPYYEKTLLVSQDSPTITQTTAIYSCDPCHSRVSISVCSSPCQEPLGILLCSQNFRYLFLNWRRTEPFVDLVKISCRRCYV